MAMTVDRLVHSVSAHPERAILATISVRVARINRQVDRLERAASILRDQAQALMLRDWMLRRRGA